MHMLRADSLEFKKFGEIYFSKVNCGAVKAWKQHQEMILNLAVPVGKIKLVLWDNRKGSKTKGIVEEHILSEQNYKLITVPPMIWTGFMGLSDEVALIANLASIPHSPDEVNRLDIQNDLIHYKW